MSGLHSVGNQTLFIFLISNLFILFSVFISRYGSRGGVADFGEIHLIKMNKKNELVAIWFALGLMTVLLMYYFSKVNIGVFVYNSDYLLLKTPSMIGLHSSFDRIIHFILRPVGVFSAIVFAYSINS